MTRHSPPPTIVHRKKPSPTSASRLGLRFRVMLQLRVTVGVIGVRIELLKTWLMLGLGFRV